MNNIEEVDLSSSYLSIDTETTGLCPQENIVVLMQIASDKGSWLIDMRNCDNPDYLSKIMADRSVLKIMHNAAFDMGFLKHHYNYDINNVWDTALAERVLLSEADTSATLQDTLARRLDVHLEKGYATAFLDYADPQKPFTPEMLNYAQEDVDYLYKLCKIQWGIAVDLGLEKVIKLENRLVEVINDMRIRGIRFDKTRWIEIAKEYGISYTLALYALRHLTKGVVENWNSPKQVKDYFNEYHDINVLSLEDFERYKGNTGIDAFLEMRQYFKAVTTYGESWLTTKLNKKAPIQTKSTVFKNRVHCNYTQIINTGRLSCSQPNLQQIPNTVADKPSQHHSCFIASPGYKLVVSDFSSQELAIIAVKSKDSTWLKALNKGWDLHSIMAVKIFGKKWHRGSVLGCEFNKSYQKCDCPGHVEKRILAKTLNFGLAYGLGVKGFADKMSIPLSEAKEIVYRYKKAVPVITEWLSDNGIDAKNSNVSYTHQPFNRRRLIPHNTPGWRKVNIGKNNPVQGTGADMTKLSMVYLDKWIQKHGYNACILHTVHDEIISEVELGDEIIFAKAQAKCMRKAVKKILGVNLIDADTVIVDRWKE